MIPRYVENKAWSGKNHYSLDMIPPLQLEIEETKAAIKGIGEWERTKKGKTMKRWKVSEKKFLAANLHRTDKELSALIENTTCTTIQAARARFGLSKGKESGRFKKGSRPWNKAVKYNAGGRSVETRFKKGQPPPTAFRNIGDVFEIPDATGKRYKFIKLAHHRQYPYGRYVWEQETGQTLTKDDMIRFRDGNPLNCVFSNLEKISRKENANRNQNRKKSGESLKKTWAVVKTFEDYGLTPPYKFKSKRV